MVWLIEDFGDGKSHQYLYSNNQPLPKGKIRVFKNKADAPSLIKKTNNLVQELHKIKIKAQTKENKGWIG